MNNEIAFRFSKRLGVVANDDLAGEPYYITITDMKTPAIPEDDGKKKVDGIAYNVPGRAHITLTGNNKKVFDGELPITQFGTIEYLAPYYSIKFYDKSIVRYSHRRADKSRQGNN